MKQKTYTFTREQLDHLIIEAQREAYDEGLDYALKKLDELSLVSKAMQDIIRSGEK